jgi:hypothetical protein
MTTGSKKPGAAEVARAACRIVALRVEKSGLSESYDRKRAVVSEASPFVAQTNLYELAV